MTLYRDGIIIDGLDVSVLDADFVQRVRAGGLTAVHHTVTLAEGFGFHRTTRLTLEAREFIGDRQADLTLVLTPDDIRRAKDERKIGLILGLQNATSIEKDLKLLQALKDLGIRIIQLTYNTANLLGDGCLEPRDGGLTVFGREVIAEMNRLGLVIDISHVGDATSRETIEASDRPVAVTHANCRALHGSPRNKPDDVLRDVADAGGVLGLTPLPAFLTSRPAEASISDYVNHIEHAVEVMGAPHVGVGSDFATGHSIDTLVPEGYDRWAGTHLPGGFEASRLAMRAPNQEGDTVPGSGYATGVADHSQFENIATELMRRGFSDKTVLGILGGNFLRLFEDVWGSDA